MLPKILRKEKVIRDSLSIYIEETREFSLLKEDEEKALALRMQKGDVEARKQFIESNLRLVINIAKRYAHNGVELNDLINYGNIGLLKAVTGFKVEKGCKFSTYATWWIRQSIDRNLADCENAIRLPSYVVSNIIKVEKAIIKSLAAKGAIDNKEIGKMADLSAKQVERVRIAMKYKNMATLDSSPFEDGIILAERLSDNSLPAQDMLLAKERRKVMETFIDKVLKDQEATVIKLRFGFTKNEEVHTLDQIGKRFGVTRERIRQIEAKALKKLQRPFTKRAIALSA